VEIVLNLDAIRYTRYAIRKKEGGKNVRYKTYTFFIRSNPEKVKEALKKRKEKINLDEILELDQKRRELLLEADALKEKRNTVSEEIGKLKREKKDAREKILAMKEVSAKIKELDAQIKEIEEKTTKILLEIPNIPHESVPVGEDEKNNVEIKKWGEPRKFDLYSILSEERK
jgi:seryl-tRNA synthetase